MGLVFVALCLVCTVPAGMSADVVTLKQAITVGVAAMVGLLVLSWTAFRNPNRNPEANRKKSLKALQAGTMRVSETSGAISHVRYEGTSPGWVQVAAILLCAIAAAAFAAPLAARKAYQWNPNTGISPRIVGAGDEVRVKFDETLYSLKGLWFDRTTATVVNAEELGLEEGHSLIAGTKNSSWGDVISGQICTNENSRMFVDVHLPDNLAAGQIVKLEMTTKVRYPFAEKKYFVEKTAEFHDTAEFELSGPRAGAIYKSIRAYSFIGSMFAMALSAAVFYMHTESLRTKGNPAEVISVEEEQSFQQQLAAASADTDVSDQYSPPPTPAALAPKRPGRRIGVLVCGLIIFMMGFLMTLGAWSKLDDGKKSVNWPTVEGRVVFSTLKEHGNSRKRYSPDVTYEYQVDGRKFQSQRISFEAIKKSKDKRQVTAFIAKYPKDGTVQVYYDPEDPGNCTLVAGMKNAAGKTKGIFVCGFIALIGAVMVALGFTRKSSESPRAVAKRKAASRLTDGDQFSGYALGR